MDGKTASLIGATGLVGGELLKLLLGDPYYSTVRILVRRPFALNHAKLEVKLVDFNDADSQLVAIENSDALFVAVGTTQKKVKGDKAEYRKVDFDIPVNAAKFCKMTGCGRLILVSAIGADSNSGNFYLKLKGEVENAIQEMKIPSVHVMRPSMLLGDRQEFRLAEKLGKGMMKALSFLFVKGLRKYRAIDAMDVAKAMLAASKKDRTGFFVYDYEGMQRLAGSSRR